MLKSHINKKLYRPDIDALRAIAIISVIAFHAFPEWVSGGFVGVDIFFVISGFLISGIILENLKKGKFNFRSFYAARVRRIAPALILVMATCLVIGWNILLPDEYRQLGKHVLGGAGFASNLILWNEAGYFDTASESKPLLHLWSLGVEEQFYLLWPLILWIFFRLRWTIAAPLFFIAGFSLATNLELSTSNIVADFYSPLARFWELMIGAFLAWLAAFHDREAVTTPPKSEKLKRQSGWLMPPRYYEVLRHLLSVCGALLIAGAIAEFDRNMPFPSWRAALPTVGTALLIAAGPQAVMNRLLSNRVLIGIGLISYPLYLWHWPLLAFANIIEAGTPAIGIRLAVITTSFALALATYFIVEKPIRFGRHRHAAAFSLCLLLIIIGATGYDIMKRNGLKFRGIVKTNIASHFDSALNDKLSNAYPLSSCSFSDQILPLKIKHLCHQYGPSDAKETIVIWGDSHADAWSKVFYEIARERGDTRVLLFANFGCPPIIGIRRNDGLANAEYCDDINQGQTIYESIAKIKPKNIVLIARWSLYVNGNLKPDGTPPQNAEFMITTSPHSDATTATARAAMEQNFPQTVKALSKISKVLILENIPVLMRPVNSQVVRLTWHHAPNSVETTLAQHLMLSEGANSVIAETAKIPNVSVLDLTHRFCSEFCVTTMENTVMYSDDNHPSIAGTMMFKKDIQSLLK